MYDVMLERRGVRIRHVLRQRYLRGTECARRGMRHRPRMQQRVLRGRCLLRKCLRSHMLCVRTGKDGDRHGDLCGRLGRHGS